jgi:hypothetical protein
MHSSAVHSVKPGIARTLPARWVTSSSLGRDTSCPGCGFLGRRSPVNLAPVYCKQEHFIQIDNKSWPDEVGQLFL